MRRSAGCCSNMAFSWNTRECRTVEMPFELSCPQGVKVNLIACCSAWLKEIDRTLFFTVAVRTVVDWAANGRTRQSSELQT